MGYKAPNLATGDDAQYYSARWTRMNVSAKGPLGAFYRVWGDGRQMVRGDVLDYFGMSGQSAEHCVPPAISSGHLCSSPEPSLPRGIQTASSIWLTMDCKAIFQPAMVAGAGMTSKVLRPSCGRAGLSKHPIGAARFWPWHRAIWLLVSGGQRRRPLTRPTMRPKL